MVAVLVTAWWPWICFKEKLMKSDGLMYISECSWLHCQQRGSCKALPQGLFTVGAWLFSRMEGPLSPNAFHRFHEA